MRPADSVGHFVSPEAEARFAAALREVMVAADVNARVLLFVDEVNASRD